MNLAMLMGTEAKGQVPTKYRVQHLDGTEFMHNVFDTMQQFFRFNFSRSEEATFIDDYKLTEILRAP